MMEVRAVGRCFNCGNVTIQQDNTKILECKHCDAGTFILNMISNGWCSIFDLEIPLKNTQFRNEYPQITNNRNQEFLINFWSQGNQKLKDRFNEDQKRYFDYKERDFSRFKHINGIPRNSKGERIQ